MGRYFRFILLVCIAHLSFLSSVPGQCLEVHVRNRPPEMIVDENNISGPLIDVITEMGRKSGFTIKFVSAQFYASLARLKVGKLDLLPRTICTQERALDIDFLGPIGYQEKEIVFIVRAGNEKMIQRFEDLEKYRVGVKAGTVYFEAFDRNTAIEKIDGPDDIALARMFNAKRFDAFIVLDKNSALMALEQIGVTDYTYADYRYILNIGNYFGVPKNYMNASLLQKIIEEMVISGEIAEIYKKHGVTPPRWDNSLGFKPCTGDY